MTRKHAWGLLLLAAMVFTLRSLLGRQSLPTLIRLLRQLRPGYAALGLGLMLVFVGCEALCSKLILTCLGHRPSYRRCLGCSFAGFFLSSITPSSTGGQPAQIYYMSRVGIPAAHGSLNMLLIAVCYQVTALGYALWAFLALPTLRTGMGKGLGLLLLFGGGVLVVLTAGMLGMMFLPRAARGLAHGLLSLLVRLRLLRRADKARLALDRQLEEYRRGADCLKGDLRLLPALLGLTFLQLTALYAVPWTVYLAFGLRGASLPELLGAQALVNLAVGSLPLPGAVGASEAAALGAFAPFFGPDLAAPGVLVSRGISFYSFLLVSGAVTLCFHLSQQARPPRPGPVKPAFSPLSWKNPALE